MNREEAVNYMKSSAMSDEQVKTVIDGIQHDTMKRLQKVVDMLAMSDADFVDDYNNQHEYPLKYGESYAYLCGYVRAELESIIKGEK
jgi:hypothetical protein